MSHTFSWVKAVAAAALLVPVVALAQDQDVIRITAGGSFERHSNIFRSSSSLSGPDFNLAFGGSSRSDTIFRGTLGLQFDREYSLQRFRLGATLLPQKFQTYDRFDHLGYSVDANWDWEFSGPFSGRVGARVDHGLMGFNQLLVRVAGGSGVIATQVDKNMITRTNPYFVARLRITPSWFVSGGVDQVRVTNSATAYVPGDFTANAVFGGFRYAPGTGTELDFELRSIRGKFDFLQLVDLNGNLLNPGIDNSYKETQALVRMSVRPSEDSLIGGFVGYSSRRYDALPQRDFSGPIAGLNVDWRPGGGFFMSTLLERQIALPGVFTANYIDVTRLRLSPRFELTGRTQLRGLFQYETWAFKGDPGLVTGTSTLRKDTLSTVGMGLTYEYTRTISFTADYRNERRSSNTTGLDYTNNVISGGLIGRF